MPPTEETPATAQGGGYDEHPFIADLYEQDPLHRGRPDVGFFVEEARTSGSPVLDIGCGTGRVLIPTARAGLEVVGLDLSPRMLAVCRERLLGEPDEVRTRAHVIEADMRRFDLGQRFRLAMIPFRSFQYLLTIEDQLTCLEEIRRHLVDDIFTRTTIGLRTVRSTPVSSCSWQERRDREHAAEQAFAADDGGVS